MINRKIRLAIGITAMLISGIIILNCGVLAVKTQAGTMRPVLFIDAGHGGIDGGAVSSGGVPEKDINLAIAKRVCRLAEDNGWNVIMTRETDKGLYGKEEGSIRAMKTADLRARRDMMRKYQPDAAVSIHLNSFREDPSVKGVQVFYPNRWSDQELNAQCEEFAEIMQGSLNETVESGKDRVPLVKDDVFIFKEEICPIVIVECGFLSNSEEAELLQTKEYQQQLAEGIMAGITEFTGVEKENPVKVIDSFEKKNKH